jgi:hypothetical protein
MIPNQLASVPLETLCLPETLMIGAACKTDLHAILAADRFAGPLGRGS